MNYAIFKSTGLLLLLAICGVNDLSFRDWEPVDSCQNMQLSSLQMMYKFSLENTPACIYRRFSQRCILTCMYKFPPVNNLTYTCFLINLFQCADAVYSDRCIQVFSGVFWQGLSDAIQKNKSLKTVIADSNYIKRDMVVKLISDAAASNSITEISLENQVGSKFLVISLIGGSIRYPCC